MYTLDIITSRFKDASAPVAKLGRIWYTVRAGYQRTVHPPRSISPRRSYLRCFRQQRTFASVWCLQRVSLTIKWRTYGIVTNGRRKTQLYIRARSGPNSFHPVPRTNCPRVPYPVWCSTYLKLNIRVRCTERGYYDSPRRCARRVQTRGRGAMHPTTHPFVRTQCHRRFAN